MKKSFSLLFLCFVAVLCVRVSFAQQETPGAATPAASLTSAQAPPARAPESPAKTDAAAKAQPAPAAVIDRSPFAQSLLFSPLEILVVKKFLEEGAGTNADLEDIRQAPYIPPIRRIILSGIVYKGPDNWIVWLNNQKLTPGNLLPEIVSMNVREDRIDLEWYDIGLNDVIRLKLRPHQIYDIVTGVLLPG